MKTNIKVSTIILLLAWMAITQSCLKKKQSLWEMSPCEFTSDEEFSTLRNGLSFKIIDATTFVNLVDTINAPIHLDSVKLFNADLSEFNLTTRYWIDGWIFGRFHPYVDVPYNDADALLALDKKTFYLSTAYDDYDTIVVSFEKCRLAEILFNNQSTLRPKGESSQGGASLYFLKSF